MYFNLNLENWFALAGLLRVTGSLLLLPCSLDQLKFLMRTWFRDLSDRNV